MEKSLKRRISDYVAKEKIVDQYQIGEHFGCDTVGTFNNNIKPCLDEMVIEGSLIRLKADNTHTPEIKMSNFRYLADFYILAENK